MDTISSLHDDILCRILSFVSTKEAVATSVLSKRWTHLWLSVTNLHFTNINIDTIESNLRFNESVYSVLASRDAAGSNFVNSFCLHIQYSNLHIAYDLAFPHVVKWINLFLRRKLKHLSLHLDVHEFPGTAKLPVTIFTCKTLVSLNLYRFNFKLMEGFSFSSNGFGLPSLKILHLELIHFSNFQDFMMLLAKCPNLEDLQAAGMSFCSNEDSLSIHQKFKTLSLPKLTRGNITRCFVFYDPVNQPQHSYDAIHISHELTKLVLVNCWNISVLQALRLCSKLQHLELYKGLYMPMETEEGDQQNWVEPEFFPQCLVSYLKTCTIWDSSSLQSELMLEKYILKNAKNLETMTIWSGREQSEIERKLSKYPKGSATCQLSVYIWPY